MHSKGGKITSLNEYWFLALLFQRAWKLEFLFTMPESSSLFEPYTSNQEDYLKNLKLTFFYTMPLHTVMWTIHVQNVRFLLATRL